MTKQKLDPDTKYFLWVCVVAVVFSIIIGYLIKDVERNYSSGGRVVFIPIHH